MMQIIPRTIESWAGYLDHMQIPVLRRTAAELEQMRQDEDNVTGRTMTAVILHDPLMTLKVLRYLQLHRSRNQAMDITTIAHAVMMLGITPFFRHFSEQPVLEDQLKTHPEAIDGVMGVVSRAFHAARYAQDWSVLRHDIESEEVEVAALLHDLAEILVWCYAPGPMLEIRRRMIEDARLRSAVVQQEVLGFRLMDLQMKLSAAWHLPKLLQVLMDDSHATMPRAQRAVLAVSLARHSAKGWNNAALPDDFAAIQKLLGIADQEVHERIQRVALKAARDWEWYGVTPSAAWLPGMGF
jgi:HD-like signal output (HDOD) protein